MRSDDDNEENDSCPQKKKTQTRLHFNLMQTIPTNVCTGSLSVTWQRWRSHHSIRHSRKPHAARTLHGSIFYRTEFIADQSFTFRVFADMTLTLTRWPSYMNWTRIASICTGRSKWTFYVYVKLSHYNVIHTDIQDATENIITPFR